MRATIAIELGWCGFGYEGGLIPTVKLGVIAMWWCRGSISEQVRNLRCTLAEAARELRTDVSGRMPRLSHRV